MRIIRTILVLMTTLVLLPAPTDANTMPRKFHFSQLPLIADNTLEIRITAKSSDIDLSWMLSPSDKAIFFSKIASLREARVAYNPLNIPEPQEAEYRGLSVTIISQTGRELIPFTVKGGILTDERSDTIANDPHRLFEYWLWSTNTPENLSHVHRMVPIIDFNQCAHLGHRIVNTSPRQCLVENGDIFLDVPEKPTQESIEISNFDECLVKGKALINTFPRRCIAAGGHIFTEPPRIRGNTLPFANRVQDLSLTPAAQ